MSHFNFNYLFLATIWVSQKQLMCAHMRIVYMLKIEKDKTNHDEAALPIYGATDR